MSFDQIREEGKALSGDFIPASEPGPQPQQTPEEAAAAQLESEAKAWAGLPYIFGRIVVKVLPELNEVYSEPSCLDWGRAMAPVARKHGWSAEAFGGVYLPLVGSTLSFAFPTWEAIQVRRAAAAAKAAQHAKPSEEKQPESTAPAG